MMLDSAQLSVLLTFDLLAQQWNTSIIGCFTSIDIGDDSLRWDEVLE